MDLASGKVVDSHNPDLPLVPASINKSATIATLLCKSGINYRYTTKIYAEGKIQNGTIHGNLLVVGGGDPTLGADVEPIGSDILQECVSALKAKGINNIEGEIRVDESIFPGPATPPLWAAGDLSNAYGTGCHGLNYQRNASGGHSVANPAAVFAARLKSALSAASINVEGVSLVDLKRGELLVTHLSPSIDEIMRSCMMRSDNLYAETFIRTYAMLCGKSASTAEGAALEMDFWKHKNMPMAGVKVVDGSGLSRSNRLTANFLGHVLKYMSQNVDYASFFPLAGQEGTLRNFLKDTPLDSYIAMKTGSMSGIQCYAGYLLDEDYAPTHVVVIMVNDFKGSRDAVKRAAAKMLLDTFTLQQ